LHRRQPQGLKTCSFYRIPLYIDGPDQAKQSALKTAGLKKLGLSSRQIKRLLEGEGPAKIKQGYYGLAGEVSPKEEIAAKLFPGAVMFLESALLHYGYTDRVPTALQIAVCRCCREQMGWGCCSVDPRIN
jgi:predicted transcriptional regulator of viral defense system